MRTWLGTASTVTSTEKWLAALSAGQCFGKFVNLAASVGNFSIIQLFNPAASGKTALVRGIFVTSSVNIFFDVAMHDTALATDNGAGVNLLDGGAAGVCHVRSAQPAAQVGTNFLESGNLAGQAFQTTVEWFAQLGANQGLVVQSFAVNVQLTAAYLWLEQ